MSTTTPASTDNKGQKLANYNNGISCGPTSSTKQQILNDDTYEEHEEEGSSSSDESNLCMKEEKMEIDPSQQHNDKDVIYAKGGAAQHMQNAGNLYFYQLCESRYDEYTKLENQPQRRNILISEIVDAVLATGGIFRTISGDKMTRKNAMIKTKDRMRQIGKPKIRPMGFGVNDVVSAKGGAVHLFPGNAKWQSLIAGFVPGYFREMIDEKGVHVEDKKKKEQESKDGTSVEAKKPSNAPRPSYQNEIVNEIIQIVHSRGGRFLDQAMNELTNKEAAKKTHMRFKDLKRELKCGKRQFVPHTSAALEAMRREVSGSNSANIGGDSPNVEGAHVYLQKRMGGFSSVKNTVASKVELKALEGKVTRPKKAVTRQKKRKKTINNASGRKKARGLSEDGQIKVPSLPPLENSPNLPSSSEKPSSTEMEGATTYV